MTIDAADPAGEFYARATLDLAEPVAVMMPANLSFVRDLGTARRIVGDLLGALPPGSHLMVTHHASDLYVAEEIFVCGTAAEISSVNSVDDRAIPCPGPITRSIAEIYTKAVRGQVDRYKDWVEHVDE